MTFMFRAVYVVLLMGVLLFMPALSFAENTPPARGSHLFPPLEPYLGGYTLDELYDLKTDIPYFPPEKDIPASVMAAVDPKSTPYPVILEEEWLEGSKNTNIDNLIAEAKKGNVVAMAWIQAKPVRDTFWARLADSLTHPGWAFGFYRDDSWATIIGPSNRGAYLGDGRAIHKWDHVIALNRLAGLAGYPEGMAEGGAYLDSAGFCLAAREWSLEAAMRGYDYAWDYAGYNYRKGCPKEGLPPDLATSWAAFHIECEYTDYSGITGACGISKRMAEEMTETQRREAKARAEELLRLREETRAARLQEQRERIRRKMPEVVAAINAHLDACIRGDAGTIRYGLSLGELQRLRDL